MEQIAAKLPDESQVCSQPYPDILIVIKKDKAKDNCIQITVHGGWGNWKSVSVDHCINEPDGKVKQIRYCDNPLPKYGGDLCPEPDLNERYISCNATNYQGLILF